MQQPLPKNYPVIKIAFLICFLCILAIKSFAQSAIITTVAGNGVGAGGGIGSFSGDGGPATAAGLYRPGCIAFDASGNMYIGDGQNYVVRRVDAVTKIITTIAGIPGSNGYNGDGIAATTAMLRGVHGLAFDASGNLYISEFYRVRKIDASGIITTIAGNGSSGHSGDFGPATAAHVGDPTGLVFDGLGNLIVSGGNDNVVRYIDMSTGYIYPFAGTGVGAPAYTGDGVPATTTKLGRPSGVAMDIFGNTYIADGSNKRLRKVDPTNIISTVAGISTGGSTGDGGPASVAPLWDLAGVCIDASGNIYITPADSRIRKIDASGIITNYAGTIATNGYSGDGGPATAARLNSPLGIAIDPAGDLYVADNANHVIRKIHGVSYAPYFIYGTSYSIAVCENAAPDSINIPLAVVDSDNGQRLVWSAVTNPAHGTIKAADTMVSNVDTLTPRGLTYGPSSGYNGTDSFTVRVTDGYLSDTIKIYVTVNPLPSITGTKQMCISLTTTLSSSVGGGAWSSGNTSIATVVSGGVVTGVAAGTAAITFTTTAGCMGSTTVTVNNLTSITGSTGVCLGNTTALSNPTTGGTWSSSATSIAAVGSSSGVVFGSALGSATITYSMGGSCTATQAMTVNPLPGVITGLNTICMGSTTTLLNSGGSWSSSNTAVVTIGSSSGSVATVSVGTTTISYTLPTGCYTTMTMSVVPLPAAISGPSSVCVGQTITLSDATGGGTWSSSATSVATVGSSSGTVMGMATGSATITYTTIPGLACTAIKTITVNTLSTSITGNLSVCVGNTTALSNGTGGGTWTSSNTSVAAIGSSSGVVLGTAAGTSTISYSSGGCMATATVTVNTAVASITGPASICSGSSIALSSATPGGTWSSSNTLVASVGTGGSVNGVFAGTATITYSLSAGCNTTKSVTVLTGTSTITGPSAVCVSASLSLSSGPGGGTWTSSATSVATVSGGTVTGVALGTTTITYQVSSGCNSTKVVTVSLSPTAITGPASVCVGLAISLSDAVGGGGWTSSNTTVSVGLTSALVTGLAAGTATITYSLGSGCTVNTTVTINTSPTNIIGNNTICAATATNLTDATTGGAWSSSNTGVATISPGGVVNGVAAGTVTISYSKAGCAAIMAMTVNTATTAISGSATVCQGATTPLSCAPGGGKWTIRFPPTASIDSVTGVVTGVGTGVAVATYTLSTGCSSSFTITSLAAPAAITGAGSVCIGSSIPLSDATTGGTWSSSATSVATIGSSSGIVNGNTLGTSRITYTASGGCAVTATVTVTPAPGTITGPASVCAGANITLSNSSGGGAWSSGNTAKATINSSGVVNGVAAGTAAITYSLGSSCTVTTTISVTASPSSITGAGSLCTGNTTTLSNATTGGTWTSSNTTVATISSGGLVAGNTAGTTLITYSTGGACNATTTISVNAMPAAITGNNTLCTGTTTALSNTVGGGVWTSSNTSVATITSGGLVSGLTPGTTSIAYGTGTGCFTTMTVSVGLTPSAISGASSICTGFTALMSDATPGGTWSTSNTGVATISSGGLVSGLTPGTVIISYATGTICSATKTFTVNALPGAITGTPTVCAGYLTNLYNTGSGVWTSSNPAVASVGVSSGIVNGFTAGTSVITYSLGAGCTVNTTVTVYPVPAPITGTPFVCEGGSTVLSDATTGGVWTSAGSAVTLLGGSVIGNTSGYATISYTLSTGCAATVTFTVSPLPNAISGSTQVCATYSILLSDAGGGAWTSGNPAVASVHIISGIVTGMVPGSTAITYTLPTGCLTTTTVTVNPLPAPITGASLICGGTTAILSDATPGGTWSSSNTLVTTIGATSGIANGLAGGVASISYTSTLGCAVSKTFTVNPAPSPIGGIADMCAGMSTMTLFDADPGGIWTSTLVTITSGGLVTAHTGGMGIVTYTFPSGCATMATIPVHPLPGEIMGPMNVCVGSTVTLIDTTIGGTWSSADATVAVGMTSGDVTGMSIGIADITYMLATGCKVHDTMNVFAAPTPITGNTDICIGATTTLTNTTPGGTWSMSSSIATLSGVSDVTGLLAGLANVTYAVGTGCYSLATVTVLPLPTLYSVHGGGNYCITDSGVHVTLSLSDIGTRYFLYNGSTLTDSAAGTGSKLDFGLQTAGGSYMVIAQRTATTCTSPMAGSVPVVIDPVVTPLVTVTAVPGDTVCAGTTVTFIATPTYGGSAPDYQWKINGVATGPSLPSISYVPVNGDVVVMVLVSNATCAATPVALNYAMMAVETPVVPDVVLSVDPGTSVGKLTNVTFTANVSNVTPTTTFQWLRNNNPIAGANAATYSTNSLTNGDKISCTVNSGGVCGEATTKELQMNVYSTAGIANVTSGSVVVYPNPAKEQLIIERGAGNDVQVSDILGHVVYAAKHISDVYIIDMSRLPTGVYTVQLRNGDNTPQNIKVVKE